MKGSQQGKAECKTKFVELRAQGFSLRNCAKQLKKSPATLSNWDRELEGEIARLKAVEMEALYEQYGLVKKKRIEMVGAQIVAITDELKGRKLSDIETDKLLDMLLRYLNQADREYVEPVFLSDNDVLRLKSKTGSKLNADEIGREVGTILFHFQTGIINGNQAARKLAILLGALKVFEASELQEKIEKLTLLLGGK